MKKNKSGFTLIELLAVIVILAVILVIAIPRILDVIETSKKDSFKNAAQLIADSAEKKKVSDKLLGKDEEITCKDVAKINDEDYASCKITFDNEGNAKVSITGKGKFDGLKITNGTKENAEVKEITKPTYGMKAVEYITNLLEYDGEGLKIDNTPNENIRYYGSNPNNYVSFNNELWRIIGVFGNNVKLVRKDNLGWLSWDSSDSAINNGYGINQWGESTYEDGTTYEGSDLMQYLNKMYYGGDTTVICYGGPNNATKVCPKDSKGNFLIINETSKELIDYYTWNTGAIEYKTGTDTLAFYQDERETKTGKNCTSNDNCNDNIIRTTEWTGYIGLPYVTDWAYASGESICEVNMIKEDNREYICNRNNWMRKVDWFWTISPGLNNKDSNIVWGLFSYANVTGRFANYVQIVFPAIYLKSNVIIESGNGSESNPYMLKLNS